MKAWRCATAGGPADLALVDMPAPVLRQDEVLVRLAAGALNFSDLLMLNGTYQVRPDPPFIPGQEIAGVVVNDAGRFRRGDRVASKVFWGGFAEYVAVRQDMAIDLPPEFEFAEGACLPVIWPTAWIALHDRARVRPGDTVLVHAGAGGVGAAAVQLAYVAGARVFATAGGAEKVALCRALGAEEAFDYRAGAWLEPFLACTGGQGADVVVDPVGGEVAEHSLKALARNGRLLIVGFASGAIPAFRANRLLLKNASAMGVYWSHDLDAPLIERALRDVIRLRIAGRLRCLVGREYSFADLPLALEDLAGRRSVGKSILRADAG
jgi:NADPH2:quinone reductase